ncbi:MAG: biotin transporter BioY [Ruminococcaceae bacterium]|nr:biotin transporter BioY [Oscillospiraceae bacterium]
MFCAILCIISQISIMSPMGVPFTLQIAAVALCGYILGAKWGTATVLTYIALGLLGLPVFSGFRGGFNVLFTETGGFLIGFIFLALLCGSASFKKSAGIKIAFGIIGVLICHLCAVLQLVFVLKINLYVAILSYSTPFLIKDIALTFLAVLISEIFLKRIKKI